MEIDVLFEKINGLLSNDFTKKKIETDLGMPKNSLSGMLAKTKPLPEKWRKKLTELVNGEYGEFKPIVAPLPTVSPKVEVVHKDFKPMEKIVVKADPLQSPEKASVTPVTLNPVVELSPTPKKPVLALKDAENDTFDIMLREFHKIIAGNPAVNAVKDKLSSLKDKALASNVNIRQKEAVVSRCDNYINGKYGISHSIKK